MYGRRMKWIYHIETGISKRIDITEVLPEGWLFGMSPVHKENIGNAARNAVRTAESEQKRLATRKKNRMIKLNLLENK
jgi:pantothenate kinase-related protein Tda10